MSVDSLTGRQRWLFVESSIMRISAFGVVIAVVSLASQARETVRVPSPPFPTESQRSLALTFMEALGFDFAHGRLDVSHHPFCGGVPDDVRITTRYSEHSFLDGCRRRHSG